MKKDVPADLERCRIKTGQLASTKEMGFNGAFMVREHGHCYGVLVASHQGWEHVSVQVLHTHRCPTWEEMSWVKGLVWNEDETVMQLHPAEGEWEPIHPIVLHLWKPQGQVIPMPPKMFI